MIEQLDALEQLGLEEGERRKAAALERLESQTWDLLPACREYLAALYRIGGRPVHADDARDWLLQKFGPAQLGRRLDWMGALFRGSSWEAVGWHKSTHPENHARVMRTWRLRDEPGANSTL